MTAGDVVAAGGAMKSRPLQGRSGRRSSSAGELGAILWLKDRGLDWSDGVMNHRTAVEGFVTRFSVRRAGTETGFRRQLRCGGRNEVSEIPGACARRFSHF